MIRDVKKQQKSISSCGMWRRKKHFNEVTARKNSIVASYEKILEKKIGNIANNFILLSLFKRISLSSNWNKAYIKWTQWKCLSGKKERERVLPIAMPNMTGRFHWHGNPNKPQILLY
jgi:hypothetical protein